MLMLLIITPQALTHTVTDENRAPWRHYDGHSYLVKTECFVNYHSAKAHCELYGAKLVSVNTQEESESIFGLLHSHESSNKDYWWVGGHYDSQSNR